MTLTDSRASLTTIMARTNSKSSSLMTSFFVVQANTDSREKTMRSDLAVNTGQIEIFWHLSHLEPHAYFVIHRGHWISFQSALLIQILPASNLELHSRIYNSFSHASKPTHVTGGGTPSTVAEVPVDAEGTDCREFSYFSTAVW